MDYSRKITINKRREGPEPSQEDEEMSQTLDDPLALRHISLRVPWHDGGWTGKVCNNPSGNCSCLALANIRESKIDSKEEQHAGRLFSELDYNELPACIAERANFMSPGVFIRKVNHPYAKTSSAHAHIIPTEFHHPPYSAAAVPFRWLNKKFVPSIIEEFNVDYNPAQEPTEPKWLQHNVWVQAGENQKKLLDCFFSAVKPNKSLCFFYAKQTPLVDEGGWVIIGAGKVKSVSKPTEYQYHAGIQKKIRSFLWDVTVEHSVRPGSSDGFILPYHEILEKAKNNPAIDSSEYVAYVPNDRRIEFAYGSEHVTHDSAIAALLACRESLEKANKIIDKPNTSALKWIDERLSELWKYRGPYPGIGAALTAFGISRGVVFAHYLSNIRKDEEDPWKQVESAFQNPISLPERFRKDFSPILCEKWKKIKPERKALLVLLSRFELTISQAVRFFIAEQREDAGITCTDKELIDNPYLVYELDRLADTRNKSGDLEPISVWTIDRGIIPSQSIEKKSPIPKPSSLEGPLDPRRIRALTIELLELNSKLGHTLMPRNLLVQKIRKLEIEPPCPVDGDLFDLIGESLASAVTICEMADGSVAFQIDRHTAAGKIIREEIKRRKTGKRHEITADWKKMLADHITSGINDEDEERAWTEKIAALKEIAASRIAVLIGSAGTGKTTVLAALCSNPDISKGGILLLAPTGKARVRLGQKCNRTAKTIAQFLSEYDCYNGVTCRYIIGSGKKFDGAQTVVIDESSMLTEEMLASVFSALKGVQRIILCGDPCQLPPIGAGRPFVDIVEYLRPRNIEGSFPRVGEGFAELTVQRRQIGVDPIDLQLARWFSGKPLTPGEDEVWSRIASRESLDRLRFVQWDNPEQLHSLIISVLVDELGLSGSNDRSGFEKSFGGNPSGQFVYCNSGAGAENWQVLSPFRNIVFGSRDLNRLIQRGFRASFINWARRNDRIPPLRGPEEIGYGDKVINIVNHRRKEIYPDLAHALRYVANGEIGMVTGYFKKKTDRFPERPQWTQVEFSSQLGYVYKFSGRDFKEDGSYLELAYAITIHKAQGSEFGKTFLILPKESRIMSRELLYTALTRQKDRVVVFHEGDLSILRNYTTDYASDTARRLTNLFKAPDIEEDDGRFYEKSLIHRSARGIPMRSKSEVIIDNALCAAGIDASYEKKFVGADGKHRLPDFTIEDDATGMTYLWEHLGMLGDPVYKRRWEIKLKWYGQNGVKTKEDGGGDKAILIITKDNPDGGIDAQLIQRIIKEIAS